ncbi:hypothetical protein Q3G72_033239 [Acer saccharum]|nr:hypothetical protein Q3G72_033239 [Acer saccharum]
MQLMSPCVFTKDDQHCKSATLVQTDVLLLPLLLSSSSSSSSSFPTPSQLPPLKLCEVPSPTPPLSDLHRKPPDQCARAAVRQIQSAVRQISSRSGGRSGDRPCPEMILMRAARATGRSVVVVAATAAGRGILRAEFLVD